MIVPKVAIWSVLESMRHVKQGPSSSASTKAERCCFLLDNSHEVIRQLMQAIRRAQVRTNTLLDFVHSFSAAGMVVFFSIYVTVLEIIMLVTRIVEIKR